jgi:protein-tyrosine-phosphatase
MPSWGIADPYRGDLHTYEETAANIQKHMKELYSLITKEKK